MILLGQLLLYLQELAHLGVGRARRIVGDVVELFVVDEGYDVAQEG